MAGNHHCEKHHQAHNFYCKTCNFLICQTCMLSEHKGHDQSAVDDFAEKARDIARQMLENEKLKIDKVEQALTDIHTNLDGTAEKERNEQICKIRKKSLNFKFIIDLEQKRLLDKVQNHMQSEKKSLRDKSLVLQNLKKNLESSCDFLQSCLSTTSNISFVTAFSSYQNKETLDEIPLLKKPEKVEDFNCREFIENAVANACELFDCDTFDRKNKEIENLRKKLCDKEEEIKSLEDKIKTIEEENLFYRQNLKDKEEEIRSVEHKKYSSYKH